MFWIVLIGILIISIVVYCKTYHVDKYRTITAWTGGVGSGKTYHAVWQAINCYKRSYKAWKRRARFLRLIRREVPEAPCLYSNIPLITKKFRSNDLTPEILLLQCRIPEHSVVLIDEVSSFLNQFEYAKNDNVKLFDEFCRLCRHYFDGNVIITDQCSANIVLQIRRRLNTIYNLSKFRYIFGISLCDIREINISDEIIAIDEKDTNEEKKRHLILGKYFKYYSSRCYSDRYLVLPRETNACHVEKKTNKLLSCPDKKFPNMIESLLHPQEKKTEAASAVSATPKVSGNAGDIMDLFQ